MLALDSSDKIRGDAAASDKVDYTLHGIVGTLATQLADGQLAATIGDLYTAGADGIVVTSIILVNTDSAARAVNLYLTPSGGTARRIIPKDLSLGIGHSLHTDGREIRVTDASGQTLSTWAVDDTPVDGETDKPISSNWAYDHKALPNDHHGESHIAASHSDQGATGSELEELTDGSETALHSHADGGGGGGSGEYVLGENSFILDETIGTDLKWSGITISGVAGATIAVGKLCYLQDIFNEWLLAAASAEASAKGMLGIAITAGTDGSPFTILLLGFIRADSLYNFVTGGAPLYISATAGAMTETAPTGSGEIVRVVGYSHDDPNTIYFNPGTAWVQRP